MMKPAREVDVLLVGPIPPARSYVGGIAVLLTQQLAHWDVPGSVAHFNTELWAREFGSTGQFTLKHLLAFVINAVRLTGVVCWRRPGVVHFHSSVRLALLKDLVLALGVRWGGGCKVVTQVHFAVAEAILLGRRRWLRRLQLRLLLLASDRIVFLSQGVRQELAAWLPREAAGRLLAKSIVLPNFTELPATLATNRTGASPVSVFFIGNIGQRKGAYDLVCALPQVVARGAARFQLVLAGPFDSAADECRLRQLVDTLHLQEQVRFLGPIRGAVKEDAFRRADIFVLPSYGEGVPISLLEAMAYGMPVVVTSVGGIPETITDGLEGYMLPPGQIEALAAALTRLINAPELRAAMGSAARARAAKYHSLKGYFNSLRPLYATLQVSGITP